MMKSLGLCLLLLLCLVAGCSGPASANKWVGEVTTVKGKVKATIDMREDGTFEMVVDDEAKSKAAGTYSISGSQVSLNATSLNGMVVGETDRAMMTGELAKDGKSLTMNGTTFTKQ